MRTRRILDAAFVVWVASCSPAVAVPETVATDSPAPQVALRADHMVLVWEVPARPEGSSP